MSGPATILARVAAAAALTATLARGQDFPVAPPPLRTDLPFALERDRLPGPPRAVGELPDGMGQPPSTLPGRLPDAVPRAMGDSPPGPPQAAPIVPGGEGAPSLLAPLGAFGGRSGPATSILPLVPGGLGFGAEAGAMTDDAAAAQGARRPPASALGIVAPAPEARRGPRTAPPLGLDDFLASTERSYPPFRAILEQRRVAAGDALSARGAFDLNLNADSRNYPLGYYRRSVHDVFFEQPLANLGGELFAGYRVAEGNWPTYYNYLNTRGGGAFVAGVKLPLLKNREIDARRAKLIQADIERRKVEPTILKQRVSLRKEAAKLYWEWVAAGLGYRVASDLVELARFRFDRSREQVPQLVSPVALEALRLSVLTREAQLVDARRRLQAAAIELSLFLRDGYGMPMIAEEAILPDAMPAIAPPDPRRIDEDVQVALQLRPEVFSLRLQARKIEIERQYAVNQLLPSLSLYVYTEQNLGEKQVTLQKDFRPFVAETSLLFDVPLQRRFARGRVQAADAQLMQLALEQQYLQERIRADVQEALTAVDAAYRNLQLFREYEQRSQVLAQAERERFPLGLSTVVSVAVIEQSALDATIKRIDVEAKYLGALAEYRAALGLDAASGVVPLPSGGTALSADARAATRTDPPPPAPAASGAGPFGGTSREAADAPPPPASADR